MMKRKVFLCFSVILLILTSCSSGVPSNLFTEAGETATLPSPSVTLLPAPDVQAAMTIFLEAYKVESYATMYSMLSELSKDAISQEDFTGDFVLRAQSTSGLTAYKSANVDNYLLLKVMNYTAELIEVENG